MATRTAFSYHSQQAEQAQNVGRKMQPTPSKQPSVHTGRFRLQRFGLAVLLLALLASTINALSLSSDARVSLVNATDKSLLLHDQKTYQIAAGQLLGRSLWNRNKITINTAQLEHDMKRQFPELASVDVSLPLLAHRPIVYIQSAQPALVLLTSHGSFVLDTNGRALLGSDTAPYLSSRHLPQINDQSGLSVVLNHQALTPANVSFIQTVVAQLAARHMSVTSTALPPAASELDVHLSSQSYVVKFNLQSSDARQQVGTFLATQSQLQKQHITPTQYIDVRVDGRAYYQ